MRKNCNIRQLQRIFSNLKAGPFPPNGKFKCYVLQGEILEKIWYGKTITYLGGYPPNDYGSVINTMYNNIDFFKATIYRTRAPIDGKEAFAIDYRNDLLALSTCCNRLYSQSTKKFVFGHCNTSTIQKISDSVLFTRIKN